MRISMSRLKREGQEVKSGFLPLQPGPRAGCSRFYYPREAWASLARTGLGAPGILRTGRPLSIRESSVFWPLVAGSIIATRDGR